MPYPLSLYIDNTLAVLGHIFSDLYNCGTKLGSIGTAIEAENWADAHVQCDMAKDYLRNAAFHFSTGTYGLKTHLEDTLDWINDNWPEDAEPFELTWQKICAAWTVNDFEGRHWTIACIDRMRELMWNEFFSIQWAQKPEDQL